MINRPQTDAEHDPIHQSAAKWITRLQSPLLTLEETLEWQQWMDIDPRHAHAFRRMEEISRRLDAIAPPSPLAATDFTDDRYDGSVPISDWRESERRTASTPVDYSTAQRSHVLMSRLSRSFSARTIAFAATVCIAVVGIGISVALSLQSRPGLPGTSRQVIETAVGENRVARLTDGSQVTLGGDTRLEISLTTHSRQLALLRGEAFFAVAKDPLRPFKVDAGSTTVTAVGTEFNVRRAQDRVVVAVVEGRVLVEPTLAPIPIRWLGSAGPKRQSTHIIAGQQTLVDGSGVESTERLTDTSVVTGWQTGHLAFESEQLRYVLDAVNRYAPKPIVVEDESVADLRITGTVSSRNVGGWIVSLEAALPLRAVETPSRIVLQRVEVAGSPSGSGQTER